MNTDWTKSSYSQPSGDCLEFRTNHRNTLVRDTQNRDAGHLAFPLAEWDAFVRAAGSL